MARGTLLMRESALPEKKVDGGGKRLEQAKVHLTWQKERGREGKRDRSFRGN